MKYEDLLDQLTPELLSAFRKALETGRWPDGRPLNDEQREHCMQAVIAYEQKHLPERERVGFIDKGRKAPQKNRDESAPLRWADTEEASE